jgi:hypothetical protein
MAAIGSITGHAVQGASVAYPYGNAIAAGSTIMLFVQNVGANATINGVTDAKNNTYTMVHHSNTAASGNDYAIFICKVAFGKDIQVGTNVTVSSTAQTDGSTYHQILRADYWTTSLNYVSGVYLPDNGTSDTQTCSINTTNTTQKVWAFNQKFTSSNTIPTYVDGHFAVTNSATRSGNANNAVTGYYEPAAIGTQTSICDWNNVANTGNYGLVLLDNAAAASVPGAPTGVSATPGNGSAQVSFGAPASDGGSAIIGYTATSSPGGHTGSGPSSPVTVNGLTNGTPYTFTVHATNAVGNSAESAPSSAVTPSAVPGAPRNVVAAAGDTEATVTFDPPTSDGGATIDHYTITASPGGATAVVTP